MKNKLLALIGLLILSFNVAAGEKYRVAWSHYTGWEPWGYAQESGILKKWADKNGIEIKLTLVNDYIESINLYTSGQFDGVVMTNMDALTIPAVGGIDSTAIIVGDFSNGNDGIVIKNGTSVKDMKGRTVRLVELSVSHYMLARALEANGMSEKDIKVVNTSDAEIANIFTNEKNAAVVTWNPPLQVVRNVKGANLVYDSSKIPGEIIDMMVVKTKASEKLKKALTGAWYETMNVMSAKNSKAKKAISMMSAQAGATDAEFKSQLKTTAMFYKPQEAVDFVNSSKLIDTMEYVRTFSFDKGLFGNGAANKNFVGMEFPGNKTLGAKANVKLRFTDKYMKMAAEGKL